MSSQRSTFILRLAMALGLTAIPSKAHLQEKNLVFNSTKIDGPYSYKSPSDAIPIVGFVTAENGQEASLLTCAGSTITVQRSALTHIQRGCPPGSPIGVWVASAGKIIYQRNPNMQIPTDSLPEQWQETVRKAKPGEFVGVSQPGHDGSIDLSLINEGGRT